MQSKRRRSWKEFGMCLERVLKVPTCPSFLRDITHRQIKDLINNETRQSAGESERCWRMDILTQLIKKEERRPPHSDTHMCAVIIIFQRNISEYFFVIEGQEPIRFFISLASLLFFLFSLLPHHLHPALHAIAPPTNHPIPPNLPTCSMFDSQHCSWMNGAKRRKNIK